MPSILLSLSLSFFGEVDGCDAGDGDVGDGDDMGDGDVGDGDDDNVLPFPGCRLSEALNCPTRSQRQQCNAVLSQCIVQCSTM